MPPTAIVVPRPAIRVLAGLVAVIALALCRWQVARHGERNAGRERALTVVGQPPLDDSAQITPAAAWRLVSWHGRFVGQRVLLAGAQHADQRGYRLLQSFMRSGGAHVLVDRGWVSAASVDGLLSSPEDGPDEVLTGQLRPVAGEVDEVPFEGHGTHIWDVGETRAPSLVLGGGEVVYVMEGTLGGAPVTSAPAFGGFAAVPDRDDTSAHYASQWFVIALGGLAFAFPRPIIGLWQKLSAKGERPR